MKYTAKLLPSLLLLTLSFPLTGWSQTTQSPEEIAKQEKIAADKDRQASLVEWSNIYYQKARFRNQVIGAGLIIPGAILAPVTGGATALAAFGTFGGTVAGVVEDEQVQKGKKGIQKIRSTAIRHLDIENAKNSIALKTTNIIRYPGAANLFMIADSILAADSLVREQRMSGTVKPLLNYLESRDPSIVVSNDEKRILKSFLKFTYKVNKAVSERGGRYYRPIEIAVIFEKVMAENSLEIAEDGKTLPKQIVEKLADIISEQE